MRGVQKDFDDGVGVPADALVLQLVAHEVGGAGHLELHLHAHDGAAWHVEVARDGRHRDEALRDLAPVGVLVNGNAHEQAPVVHAVVAELASCGDDLLFGKAAFLRRERGGVFLHALLQLVEAVAPLLDVIVVDEVLVDEHVQDGQAKRGVGAGDELEHLVGAAGKPVHAGVDHDELRAALHKLDERMAPQSVGVRLQRLFAQAEHVIGTRPVGVVPGLD